MGRALSRQRGLTIAETLVSLTVLSLLMIAVVNLIPSSLTVVRMTRTGWLAHAAAQDKIENLAGTPFPSLQVGLNEESDVTLSNGEVVHLVTTVTTLAGHDAKRLKRIACEATWKGRATKKKALHELYVHAVRR
jgi:Tfp pilus assembly protein PilV